jgi:hypothetical protein
LGNVNAKSSWPTSTCDVVSRTSSGWLIALWLSKDSRFGSSLVPMTRDTSAVPACGKPAGTTLAVTSSSGSRFTTRMVSVPSAATVAVVASAS